MNRTGPSRWRGCNHCSQDNLQQDLADRRMANPMDQVTSHHTSKERQLCSSAKVMLKIILNRLKPQVEKIITEEQTGIRAGRSTTEQIFSLRILREKYLQHPQDLYHVFVDFKKAFDGVWHAALWATKKKYEHQHQPYPNYQKPL